MLNRAKTAAIIAGLALFGFVIFQVGAASNHQKNESPPRKDRGEYADTNQTKTGDGNQVAMIEIECGPNCSAKHSNEDRNESYFSRMLRKTADDPLIILTGVLAVSTFGLVIGVLTQVRDGRRTSERQLRAYVLVKTVRVFDFGVEKIIQTQCIIMNFGQTPAYDVAGWAGVTYDEFPVPLDLPKRPADLGLSQIVLGQKGKIIFVAKQARQMTGLELQKMRNGASTLYIYGEISYRDIFGTRWKSHFRFMYGGPGGENTGGKVTTCSEGNYEEKI